MKKILFTLCALVVLGATNVWAAGTLTTIERGKYEYSITTTDVATANNWTKGPKTDFKINDDLSFKGYGANATLNGQTDGSKGARIYESQNELGASSVNVSKGWIESINLEYNINADNGVLCTSIVDGNPIPENKRIVSGTTYTVNATTFPFYAGRTATSGTNGRCDIINWKVVYYKTPTAISLPATMTVAVGNTFQIGQVTPFDSYYEWSTNDDSKVSVDQNGVIVAKSAGEVTITVSSVDGQSKSCVVNVVAAASDESVTESYTNLTEAGNWSSGTTPVDFDGDNNPYSWKAFYYQYYPINEKLKVNGAAGVMLATNTGYLSATIEGGVKAIAFDWKIYEEKNSITTILSIDDLEIQKTLFTGLTAGTTGHFERLIEQKKNVELKLLNNNQNDVYGPITIVPYLLYTTKNAEASAVNGAYTNTDLINNTTGTAVEYSLEDNEGEATIDTETGAVTILKEGQVKVVASWGEVSTSYILTTHAKPIPEVSFANAVVAKDLMDGSFVNVLTKTAGSGNVEYTSSRPDVASVADDGTITLHMIGSTTITANVLENDNFAAASTDYELNVTYTPVENTYFKETFVNCGEKPITNKDTLVEGLNGVYDWSIKNFQRWSPKNEDMVGGELGIRVRYEGHIAMNESYEGGIKAVAFKWHPTNTNTPQLQVSAGDVQYLIEKKEVATAAANEYQFARLFGKQSNVQLSIENIGTDAAKSPYVIVGPITIVPYLLYTEKEANADLADETYINEQLINNTDEGDITYSIVEETDIATIDAATGVVTLLASGTITVQAQWGDVTTSYTLTINRSDFTPTFAQNEVTKNMDDPVFTNTLSDVPEDATGERTYSSSDERVAKVDNNGQVTILGIGTAMIEVTIAEDAKYNETSASYSLTVNEPATGYDVTEGFTGQKWTLDATELKGDLCDWTTYQTRRNLAADSIESKGVNMGAEWMYGEAADKLGYIESKGAVDGGVKRIYFTWVKTSGTEANRSFTVTVGSSEDVVDLTGLKEGTYWHNFNIRENSVIRIANTSTSNFKAGPIVITPYIFYQHRADTIMATSYVYPTVYKQTLIDNTESVGTITYESDNTTAAEVSATCDVTIKAAAAEPVTITAKWQPDGAVEHYVTTSYKLFITAKQQRSAEFTNSTMTVARGETPVNDIILGSPAGDSEPEINYESSDKEVAVIVDNQVTTVGPGTATITAHIGETTKCLSQDITYSLTVTYVPVDGTYFTETFPNTTTTDYVSKTEHIEGRDNVYQWNMQQYRRTADDQFNGEQGTRIRYTTSEGGYIEMDGNQEGGIKEVVFNYCASGNGMEMHYFVQVGETTHDFHPAGKTVAAQSRPYAHTFNEASNTKLKIYVNTEETPKQTNPIIGEIKIVPYLLYTEKEVTVNPLENSTYTNTAIINNIPVGGTVTYSIENQGQTEVDAIAVINAETGEVTMKSAGTVKVIATWGDVTTSYLLTIELPTPVISGLVATTIDLDGGSYTPFLTATIGEQTIEDAVFELESSDLTKAIVQDGTTFVPVANGSANMTATLKAGTFKGIAYKSVSLSNIALTINAYTPEANFVETFSNLETGESTETTEFNGDNNVYTWSAHNYTKSDDAIVINTADGSLSSKGVQEGGIKYMTFKWLASEKATEAMGFVVTMNGESATYHFNTAQRTTEGYPWERMFNAKQNSQFSITLEEGSSKGVKIMDAEITIVPYLLYTEKEATIEVGQTFTNEALINNLGEETITYSIVSGSEYATIDGDEITAIAEGDVVVKASWNEDQIYTTYTVHVNPMSALVISEEDEDLATLVAAKAGETLDITLQRTMVADGAYSTIFLPFAMSTTQIAAVFGEGTQVAQLLSSELVGDLLTFNFDFVTEMSAGVPYLINPTQNVSEANIANVTIVKPEEPVTVEGGKFNGILAKQPAMDIDGLYFLGDGNILVTYPEIHKQEVQGLRAYFTLANSTPQLVARCVIGRTHPTILPLVDGKPVVGVKKVIINNQMVIIRNAEMYNAQGIKIQ